MNREEWLNELVAKARPMFEQVGSPLPENVRVAMGMTSSRSHIGECWHSVASADGGREIFVSPTIDANDEIAIVGTLVHELCHAALPDETGHKKPFKDLGLKMFLQGKPTQMRHGSEEFAAVWEPILKEVGKFPGVTMNRDGGPKKQTTYMVKVECHDCDVVFRMTKKHIVDDMCCPCCKSDQVEVG